MRGKAEGTNKKGKREREAFIRQAQVEARMEGKFSLNPRVFCTQTRVLKRHYNRYKIGSKINGCHP